MVPPRRRERRLAKNFFNFAFVFLRHLARRLLTVNSNYTRERSSTVCHALPTSTRMLGNSQAGGWVTRAALVEAIAVAVALALGYGGETFARRGAVPTAHASPPRLDPPTATAAPAITFTPVPTPTVGPTDTPTVMPTATPTSQPTRQPPSPTPTPVVYVVQAGDSLESISQKFGVSVDAIVRANHLSDPNSVPEGRRLNIPRK